MSDIVLTAETGSDIPPELAEKYGIYLVPMHVSFGSETLDDGSFPAERIFEYYAAAKEIPRTSACSPGDFSNVFDAVRSAQPGKHILHLAYSAVTTSSYQNALLSASEYPPGTITSFDTAQVSVGQAAVVIKTAQLLKEHPGLPLDEVIKAVSRLCRQIHMCFLPDDLEYLRAGGRVSNAAYMGSRILNMRPCIEIIGGVLTAAKKYRGSLRKAAPRLIREYTQKYGFNKDCLYLVRTAGLDADVCEAAETEAKECGFREILWIQAGCVITVHGGPGCIGLAGFSDAGAAEYGAGI